MLDLGMGLVGSDVYCFEGRMFIHKDVGIAKYCVYRYVSIHVVTSVPSGIERGRKWRLAEADSRRLIDKVAITTTT